MDRAPGLSVRLKLTLSYAGFLMLAGGLLLATVWVFLLRDVPYLVGPGGVVSRSGLARNFAPAAGAVLVSCWCSVFWEGGFSPATCSPR